jgi:hypothetical protein
VFIGLENGTDRSFASADSCSSDQSSAGLLYTYLVDYKSLTSNFLKASCAVSDTVYYEEQIRRFYFGKRARVSCKISEVDFQVKTIFHGNFRRERAPTLVYDGLEVVTFRAVIKYLFQLTCRICVPVMSGTIIEYS